MVGRRELRPGETPSIQLRADPRAGTDRAQLRGLVDCGHGFEYRLSNRPAKDITSASPRFRRPATTLVRRGSPRPQLVRIRRQTAQGRHQDALWFQCSTVGYSPRVERTSHRSRPDQPHHMRSERSHPSRIGRWSRRQVPRTALPASRDRTP